MPDTAGEETEPTLEDWPEIRADIKSQFGDDVDLSVREYSDHLDVRILPNGAAETLESEYDIRVVPYNACRMTIRKVAEADADTGPATTEADN